MENNSLWKNISMKKYIPWKNDSFEKFTPKKLGSRPLFIDILNTSS
jgi:hypothetical protein